MKYTAHDIREYLNRYYTPWVFETWAGRSIVYAVFVDKQGILTTEYAGGMYKYEMCLDMPAGETMLEFRAKHENLDYQPFYEICAALADQASKPIEYQQARFLVDNYYDECTELMDTDIMETLLDRTYYYNRYELFAAYLVAHREKYGVDFII